MCEVLRIGTAHSVASPRLKLWEPSTPGSASLHLGLLMVPPLRGLGWMDSSSVLLSANFLLFVKDFLQNGVYVSPLAGLKIIIRLTQGFATLTLGFYVAGSLSRQYDAHQPPSTMSTQSTTSTTAAKRQKPGGRHIEAQGKPGRQARRSPG